jgi:uncharacterized protein with FMN-binding domain
MEQLLNYGSAWIAMGLTLILAIVYMTRKMIKASENKTLWIKINRKLRVYHKEIGGLLIATGLIHGLASSMSVLSFNMGTLAWIFSIVLGLNWLFRGPLSKSIQWMKIHRILTIGFVLVLMLHLNEVGGVQIINILINSETAQTTTTLDTLTSGEQLTYGNFKDGTYTGSATGYGTGLTVEIILLDNTITSITIIDHNERNSQYYSKAFSTIPSKIISSQSLDVDTVSGATFSSVGIINAVNSALSMALIEGSLPSNLTLPTKKGH